MLKCIKVQKRGESLFSWATKNKPSLLDEWDYDKNVNCTPYTITAKTKKKVFWRCINNHSYESSVNNRANGSGCPYCNSKKILPGENDFKTWCLNNNSNLINEWDYKRNLIKPDEIAPKSKKKVYWLCNNGHSFQSELGNRTNSGTTCPYCSGKRAISNKTDLVTYCRQNHISMIEEWDYEKNTIDPSTILPQSHLSAFWVCNKGHRWEARIQNRLLGAGCPYCSGHILWERQAFITEDEELMKEWDYENNSLDPSKIRRGSQKRVFWVGKCGHRYEQMVSAHASGSGCTICSGKYVSAGDNDLATAYPEIAKLWDYEKNNFPPTAITAHSTRKCWWKCRNGHSFCTTVGYMTRDIPHLDSCPICNKDLKTSFPEQAIYYYCKKHFKDTINQDYSFGVELDIYIPSIRVAIEYDGIRWHNNDRKLNLDNKKDEICKKNNITLYRFRDPKMPDTLNSVRITCIDGRDSNLLQALNILFSKLGITNFDIDLKRDSAEILSLFRVTQKENSLAKKYPKLASEWHPTRNGTLTPENVTWGSAKKVWWKCNKCGEEWSCSPAVRTSAQNQGCPKCTMDKVRKEKSVAVINLDTGEVFDSIGKAAISCDGRVGDISTCCRGEQKTAFGYRWAFLSKGAGSRKQYHGRVKNITNGMIFDSLQDAAKWCNGKLLNIGACCRKRQKTAYGYEWEFMDEID